MSSHPNREKKQKKQNEDRGTEVIFPCHLKPFWPEAARRGQE